MAVLLLVLLTNVGTYLLCQYLFYKRLKKSKLLPFLTVIEAGACGPLSIKIDVAASHSKLFNKLLELCERE